MLILLEPKSSLENFHFATIGWLNRDRQLNKSHNVQYKVVYLQKNKLHSNMYYTGWNCCNSWCFMSWGSIQGEHHPNFHWSMYLFQCLIRSHLESTCQNKCLRRVLASECSRRLIVDFQIICGDWEWGPPLPWQSVNVSSFGQYCKNLKRKKKTYFKLKFNLNNHDIRNYINNRLAQINMRSQSMWITSSCNFRT